MKKGTAKLRTLGLLLPLLAAFLAAGCEDTMTEELKEEVRIAALPDRSLTILAPATGASLTPSAGSYSLKDGESFSVSATMASGYTFVQWQQVGGSGTATFANAGAAATTLSLTDGDATIQATFSNTFRTLTVTNDGHGTTTPASSASVGDGLDYSLNASPLAGYVFDHWTATVNASYVTFANANNAATTVKVSGGDATINAGFKAGTYAVTTGVNNAAYGSVSPSGAQNITYGNTLSVTATVASVDHSFANWTVSPGGALSLSSTTAATTTISNVTAAATLTANFSVKTYLLTVSSVAGGYASFSSRTVTANVATSITAYTSPTYRFTGWEKVSGAGTVTFGSASSATTTVALSGGIATIRPTFAKTIPSLATLSGGSTYAPGTKTFPSFFASAVCESDRLVVLGSSTNGGTNSVLGYVNIATPTNLLGINGWSGTEMTAITASPTYLYATTDISSTNAILSVRLSDGQFGTISSGTGAVGGRAIHWDGSTLWAFTYLSTAWAVRDVSTSTLKPTGTHTLTDADNPALSLYDITSSGQGLILMGYSDVDSYYRNHLSIYRYAIPNGTLTSPYYRSEDMTSDADNEPWFDMDMETIRCVSVNPDGEYAAVLAPYADGSFWIRIIDWTTSSLDLMGTGQICDTSGEVLSCFYTDNYVLAAGIKDSKATIWIIDVSDSSNPTVTGIYQNNSYVGGAFYICRSDSSPSTYFVVCKKTAAGTEKLEVIPLTLSEN